jgi:hypothetical protein
VTADDHATVLKVRAKWHRDLSRAYNQVACWLHAVLCELVPGGVSRGDHRRPGCNDGGRVQRRDQKLGRATGG